MGSETYANGYRYAGKAQLDGDDLERSCPHAIDVLKEDTDTAIALENERVFDETFLDTNNKDSCTTLINTCAGRLRFPTRSDQQSCLYIIFNDFLRIALLYQSVFN